jgi:hypothetical protein
MNQIQNAATAARAHALARHRAAAPVEQSIPAAGWYAGADMLDNFRRFETGPDPFSRTWKVEFQWLQTGISIRHADTVDCKFLISRGDAEKLEKVVALRHTDLLALAASSGRPVTDPWCMKLAALHLKYSIETGRDAEKTVLAPALDDLTRCNAQAAA